MSALGRVAARVRWPAAPARRSLHGSACRRAGKESELGNEARPADVERHKRAALDEQKRGEAAWKEALASDSESAVKADRGEAPEVEDLAAHLKDKARENPADPKPKP